MKNKNFISENIQYLMAIHGLTQEQFGVRLGWSTATVNNYINKSPNLKADKLQQLSSAFDISVDDLIGRDLKTEGISNHLVIDKEEEAITRELVSVIARYEKALKELEQSKTATEEDYEALWETVRRADPELAQRIEQEMQRK